MKYAGTVAFALLSLAALTVPALAAEPVAIVEVAEVGKGGGVSVLRLPGTVLSTQDAQISAEVTGHLTWVAEVGDLVRKGEPLATIDDHLLQLQLRNDWAEIERLQADIDYNRRQLGRLEALAQQNNTSKSGLDEVQSRLQMLLQEQRIAEVVRERTIHDLGRARVRAPFSGVIVSREADIGEYKEPGDPLLRLVDTQSLEISVNAPLRTVHHNQPESQVQVEGDGRQLLARIRAVVPVGDSQSRMMEFRLTLEPGHWYIGEAVTVELPDSSSTNTLTVPRDALVLRDQEVFVYTLTADNTARKVAVITSPGHGSDVAVEGELEPGALVVVRGAERLRDGQPVKVNRREAAGSPDTPG
jgi:RND family efflux transporter MFP subunit